MSIRIGSAIGLAALLGSSAAIAQNDPGDAQRNWGAIVACGNMDSADARHRCIDDVLQRTGVLSSARVEQSARQDFGRENQRREPPPPAPPVPSQAVAQPAAASPARTADIDELVTTIASLHTVGYRRLRVTTAEGSVWEQTQAETFGTMPKVGDAFTVVRGAMDSYRCRFGSGSRYRCERVD